MPRYGDIKFVNFLVKCPRDLNKIYKMKMSFCWTGDRWLNSPCNGCEYLNGLRECAICTARITSMFFHDPDLDVSTPIVPTQIAKQ